MLLRYAIVLFVSLNLGAAGWWMFAPQPAVASMPVATGPSLRLLETSKRDAPQQTLSRTTAPAAAADATQLAPAASVDAAPAVANVAAVASKPPAQSCLRFGPFADDAARATARQALAAVGVNGISRESRSTAAHGWNVFLPPLGSYAAAQAMAEKIKATGFSDLFVMRDGSEANSIALGRFGSEASARRRQAELHGKGIEAQVAPVGGGAAKLWLDARLPAEVQASTLSNIGRSSPHDCAGLR